MSSQCSFYNLLVEQFCIFSSKKSDFLGIRFSDLWPLSYFARIDVKLKGSDPYCVSRVQGHGKMTIGHSAHATML